MKKPKSTLPEAPPITHAELVALGCRWLRTRRRLRIVLGEFRTNMTSEQPDCIGWKASGWSVLIEVKVSRSDFLRDKHKIARRLSERGMGQERFFLAPEGMLHPDELPDGWGLLEVSKKGRVGIARDAARGKGLAFAVWDPGRCREELTYALAFVRRLLGVTKHRPGVSVPDDIQTLLRMTLTEREIAVVAPLVTAAVVG